MGSVFTYNPDVFNVANLDAAKRIILTNEGVRTAVRWERETPYLAGLLGERLGLEAGTVLIDYGCGIGRMAKALIEQFGCTVIGVDISPQMRSLAPAYVGHETFSVVSRDLLGALAARGLQADAALCVWVLQHCARPAEDVGLIVRALKPGARLGLVNARYRCVPTKERAWVDDRLDIRSLLSQQFEPVDEGVLDTSHVGEVISETSFWGTYVRRS